MSEPTIPDKCPKCGAELRSYYDPNFLILYACASSYKDGELDEHPFCRTRQELARYKELCGELAGEANTLVTAMMDEEWDCQQPDCEFSSCHSRRRLVAILAKAREMGVIK